MNTENTGYPEHIGIILDGNRRFAKRQALKPWRGHESGAQKVESLIEWAKDFGIKELTLFAFSFENFKRPKEEVDFLMNIFEKEFDKLHDDERLEKYKVKVNIIGKTHLFPKNVQEKLRNIQKKTEDHDGYKINFAMGYGGRDEIVEATRTLAKKVKEKELEPGDIDEDMLTQNMFLQSQPDLIIRTSEQRLSGFLTWQSVYSEIMFLPEKLWPEITKEDFRSCLDSFARRKRRFGK